MTDFAFSLLAREVMLAMGITPFDITPHWSEFRLIYRRFYETGDDATVRDEIKAAILRLEMN